MENPWDIKIKRAQNLTFEFNKIVDDYMSSNPAGISQELINGNEIQVKLHITRQPPDELAAISGEVIHNLRSALDAITFSIVTEKTKRFGVPQKDGYEKTIQFPIEVKKRNLSDYKFLKHFKREGFYQDLNDFQPYKWSEEFIPENKRVETNKGHHLALLQELSNKDKHRGINFVFCTIKNFMVICPKDVHTDGSFHYSSIFRNDEIILRFNLVGTGNFSQVSVVPEFSISFQSSEYGFVNQSVKNQLDTLLNQVTYCIRQLEFHLDAKN
jgi:hypothetical protein